MSDSAIHSESKKVFRREWSKGGLVLQFFSASLITLPGIYSHVTGDLTVSEILLSLLCPGLFVLGAHIILFYNRYEITEKALNILPDQQYDHSHIQKERIRSYEIIPQNWISRALLGTKKEVIHLKYDKYEETILYSTDPELIAWLDSVVAANREI